MAMRKHGVIKRYFRKRGHLLRKWSSKFFNIPYYKMTFVEGKLLKILENLDALVKEVLFHYIAPKNFFSALKEVFLLKCKDSFYAIRLLNILGFSYYYSDAYDAQIDETKII